MSKSKKNPATTNNNAATVIEYLLAHPKFFNEHSHVLAQIDLAHDSGTASSLIERQVSVLRMQNHKSRAELHEVTENARLNEQLSDKIHQLCLRLIAADNLSASLTQTISCLNTEFGINRVKLCLWQNQIDSTLIDLPCSVTITSSDDAAFAEHLDRLEHGEVVCGQLSRKQIDHFFGQHNDLASAALLPLHSEKAFGVIGLGCVSEDRFRRDLGTVFLTRLAELVSHKLWLDLNAY